IVAHGKRLPVGVAHHQVRIYLGNVFRNQTKLRRVLGFFGVLVFVMKRDRLERQDGFARLVHRANVPFKTPRGGTRAELAAGIYDTTYAIGVPYCNAANVADKASVTCGKGGAITRGADGNNVIGRSHVSAGFAADRDIVATCRKPECSPAKSLVIRTGYI